MAPSVSSPMTSAAAPSPKYASSGPPAKPARTSAATASAGPVWATAARSAPIAPRTDPITSYEPHSSGKRRAAWTAVAFVLSRYGGDTVANHRDSIAASGTARRAALEASTAIVVASSS